MDVEVLSRIKSDPADTSSPSTTIRMEKNEIAHNTADTENTALSTTNEEEDRRRFGTGVVVCSCDSEQSDISLC